MLFTFCESQLISSAPICNNERHSSYPYRPAVWLWLRSKMIYYQDISLTKYLEVKNKSKHTRSVMLSTQIWFLQINGFKSGFMSKLSSATYVRYLLIHVELRGLLKLLLVPVGEGRCGNNSTVLTVWRQLMKCWGTVLPAQTAAYCPIAAGVQPDR